MKRRYRFLGRGPRKVRTEVDDEIEAHLEERIADLERSGLSPEEARVEALRRFGDVDEARRRLYRSARQRDRKVGAFRWLDSFTADLALALRRARIHPGPTFLTVLVFAIGVGLTTLTFGMVDQILLRPLPFPDPDRLVRLESMGESLQPFPSVSATNWSDWREADAIASSGLHRPQERTVTIGDRAVVLEGTGVAGEFFETLQPSMWRGRALTEAESEEMAAVAVVSRSLWASLLGGAGLDGLTLRLDGLTYDVVGILDDALAYPSGSEFWVPTPYLVGSGGMRNNINYSAVARLSPGSDHASARRALQVIADRIRQAEPEAVYSFGVGVTPLREAVAGPVDQELKILLWASFVVLLVGCANLAGLALARGTRRYRELAVRTALGAKRRSLVAQLLTEHMAVGLTGALIGLLLAVWGTASVANLLGDSLPRAAQLTVDWRVAAAGVVISLAAVLLAGALPALRGSRVDPADHLGATAGSERRGRALPGAGLVVAELILTVALLGGAGLLVRSFASVVSRELGFDSRNVAAAPVRLYGSGDANAMVRYWEEVIAAANTLPGVKAAVASGVPLGPGFGATFITVEGVENADIGSLYVAVSDDYFDVMGVPLLAGRPFGPQDGQGSERVTIINRAFAEHFWPGQSALGKRIRADSFESWMYGGTAPWLRIVGVVDDVRSFGFEVPTRAQLYVLFRQVPRRTGLMTVVAKSEGPTRLSEIERTVSDVDRQMAVEFEPLEDWVRDSLGDRRLLLQLIVAFSVTTLGLAALGLYGLVAHAVGVRRREIALRMALGAQPSSIGRLVLGQGLMVVGLGLGLGLLLTFWTSPLLEQFLVDVTPVDPLTYGGVTVILLGAATLAIVVPTTRATRARPAEVLRD